MNYLHDLKEKSSRLGCVVREGSPELTCKFRTESEEFA
jgi:hypothetical protein